MAFFKNLFKSKSGSPEEIRPLLARSIDDRTKFILVRQDQDNEQEVPLTLKEIHNDHLIFEHAGGGGLNSSWKDQDVLCLFSVSLERGEDPTLFSFESTLIDITSQGNIRLVFVDPPSSLDKRQRRKHVRVNTARMDTPNFTAWRLNYKGQGYPEVKVNFLGVPLLKFDRNMTKEIRVHNISAGGIRISYNYSQYKEAKRAVKEGAFLYLQLVVPDHSRGMSDTYHVVGRVVRTAEFKRVQRHDFSLQFYYLGEKSGTQTLTWSNIKEDGIDDLARWVNARTLDYGKTAR